MARGPLTFAHRRPNSKAPELQDLASLLCLPQLLEPRLLANVRSDLQELVLAGLVAHCALFGEPARDAHIRGDSGVGVVKDRRRARVVVQVITVRRARQKLATRKHIGIV